MKNEMTFLSFFLSLVGLWFWYKNSQFYRHIWRLPAAGSFQSEVCAYYCASALIAGGAVEN